MTPFGVTVCTLTAFMFYALCTITQGGTHLRAGFGVNFKPTATVQTGLFKKYLAIDIELPTYGSILGLIDNTLKCRSDQNSQNTFDPSKHICSSLSAMTHTMIDDIKMHESAVIERLVHLRIILLENTRAMPEEVMSKIRNKRGLAAVFTFISSMTSMISTFSQRKQLESLSKTVHYLVENDFKVKNTMKTIASDLVLLANGTAKEFELVKSDIRILVNRVSTLTSDVNHIIREINQQLDTTQGQIHELENALAFANNVSLTFTHTAYTLMGHFEEIRDYLRRYETGIIDLLNGKIPTTLVTPRVFKTILRKLEEEVLLNEPQFRVLFDNINHYFTKEDIQYTIVNSHIVVNVPVYLVKRNQKPLTLFQIETCYVPYSDEGSYTRVKFEHEYIAVGGENFIELTVAQLQNCKKIEGTFLCEDHLVQLSKNSLTCSSTIYFNSDPETINKHCSFSYIHKIDPPPCVLEADDKILLSNIGEKWSFRCESDNVPKRVTGSNFAVIDRDSLCRCALTGDKFYVPERLSYCTAESHSVILAYPINAAAVTVFYHRIQDKSILANLSKLYDHPRIIDIPTVEFVPIEHLDDTAIYRDYSKELDMHHLADLINNNEPLYWDAQEKTQSSMKM